jgi:hypothetical protein
MAVRNGTARGEIAGPVFTNLHPQQRFDSLPDRVMFRRKRALSKSPSRRGRHLRSVSLEVKKLPIATLSLKLPAA